MRRRSSASLPPVIVASVHYADLTHVDVELHENIGNYLFRSHDTPVPTTLADTKDQDILDIGIEYDALNLVMNVSEYRPES